MTYDELLLQPKSKKITIVEVDSPLGGYKWINYEAGIWFTRLTPGSSSFVDDRGNTAYWDTRNDEYYNIQSLNVDGELYTEVVDLANLESTNKSWFYDEDTTDFYIHFDNFDPPNKFRRISPGAAIGFTHGIDTTSNNYFQDIYYNDYILSLPNLEKSKDPLFYGILRFEGGNITFDNTDGYFDDFASRDLYNQPVRIALGFEELAIEDYRILYTGRVEDFSHDLTRFNLVVADQRKQLSRSLPVNELDSTAYPNIISKHIGTPIPIAFGDVINGTAYKVTDSGSTNTYVFCDTEFNNVTAGITVVDKDGASVTPGGTITDGTFTASSTEDLLYVTFSVTAVENGLDIISDILENYEGIAFNAFNYNTGEWSAAKASVADSGIWIGKGKLMTSADVIEQICVDNNGIFEVLDDGRYTFRLFDANRASVTEIQQDELMQDAKIVYESDEYLTSVKVEYSEDLKEKEPEIYTNKTEESEIFGRYRQYKEQKFTSRLTNETDSITLSNRVLERSNFIYPTITLQTKIQNSELRVLDIVTFTYQRQNGKIIVPRSRWEVLGINLDLTGYFVGLTIRQIEEVGATNKELSTKLIPSEDIKLLPNGDMKLTITEV